MRTSIGLALSGLAFAGGLWGTATLGAEATATVNVRSGPGVGYAIVDTLSAGEDVDIDHCVISGWCLVHKVGPDGWVSARYLTDNDGTSDGPAPKPEISFGFSIEGFNFSFGGGSFTVGPTPPSSTARVCFYQEVGYRGDGFCLLPGQSLSSLGSWNDEISSIDVRGGAQALVCEDARYKGTCLVVSRDVRDLGRRGVDRISSIKVR